MIHITSEGNLFTSFCNSVAGTARFHHLAVTALFQFFIQSFFLFLLVNFNLFAIKIKKKRKKKVLQDCFCVPYLLQESIPSGFETYKASSSGSVV